MSLDLYGFKGKGCDDLIKKFTHAMKGKVKSIKKKNDYYAAEETQRLKVNRGMWFSMAEIEVIILSDGSFLINRSSKANNDILYKLFKDYAKDPEALKEFMSIADESEIIVGNKTFCG